jgi:filamentous hemagglutinin family protein
MLSALTRKAVAARSSPLATRVLAVALSLVIAAPPSLAQQLPTGGSVAAGNVSIGAPQNGTLNINQSSNQAIINWNTFSVGTGNTVNFNQPSAASATLNRVISSTPSSIAGTINAPGTVMLVNPNGIVITKSGVVNAGSFVASTLGITNEDFLAGRYHFQGNGASKAVVNAGRVNVSDGGFAAFLGGRVANHGVITARFGKVALGAGEVATLDLAGDGFLSVAVPSNQLQNVLDKRGKPLVSNSGKIYADGGSVYLSAATASKLLQNAVNVPGTIRANSVGTHAGKIVISGGDGGIVNVGGHLTANGGKGGNGGSIKIAGAKVSIPGKIAANGKAGGRIAVTSAGTLSVAGKVSAKGHAGAGGRINLAGKDVHLTGARVNASGATHGGRIAVTSAGALSVAGKVSAKGHAGAGGSIDLAGKDVRLTGAKVNASGATVGGQVAVTSAGALAVAGKVSAKGHAGAGGSIDLAGKDIQLTGVKVDASGATGGGLVRIGGAFQGGVADPSNPLYQAYVGRWGALPPIATASTVTADAATTINVSAHKAGDGGTAVIWSNEKTSFAGAILGTGGASFGKGGYAEVSSKAMLDFSGRVNLKASLGPNGTLLLDPADVTISSSPTLDVTLLGGIFSPISGVSTGNILSTALELALGLSNIIVTTTNIGIAGSGNGDITVSAPITWSNSNTLTLTADRNIAINSTITASNGTLVLSSNGGTVSQTAGLSVSKLALTGAGATNTLTDTSNNIGTLAGNTGTVNLNNGANALTINTVAGTNGLTTSLAGGITLATSSASGIDDGDDRHTEQQRRGPDCVDRECGHVERSGDGGRPDRNDRAEHSGDCGNDCEFGRLCNGDIPGPDHGEYVGDRGRQCRHDRGQPSAQPDQRNQSSTDIGLRQHNPIRRDHDKRNLIVHDLGLERHHHADQHRQPADRGGVAQHQRDGRQREPDQQSRDGARGLERRRQPGDHRPDRQPHAERGTDGRRHVVVHDLAEQRDHHPDRHRQPADR